MKKIILFSFILAALILSSCTPQLHSDTQQPTAKDIPPDPNSVPNVAGKAIGHNANALSAAEYAPPTDVFDSNKPVLTVDKSSVNLAAGINNFDITVSAMQNNGYVWKYGYYLGNDGKWKEFSFSGDTIAGTHWILATTGTSKTLSLTKGTDVSLGDNYIISYLCKKYSGKWKCGCQSAADDSTCNKWMLRSYTLTQNTGSAPSIQSLNPTSGSVETKVTISGSGFTAKSNTINFDPGDFPGVVPNIGSSDGKTLVFNIPSELNPSCFYPTGEVPPCMMATRETGTGQYKVSVSNVNGKSNSVAFSVTSSKKQTRSFYMGFQPMPYDSTPEADDVTFKTISERADIISDQFNGCVPWEAAFKNTLSEEKKFNKDIAYRLMKTPKNLKVYLEVSAINQNRKEITGICTETWDSIPFTGYKFDSPEVITAYTNYVRYMIQKFNPAYVTYGIEADILANLNPAEFPAYVRMTKQVYTTLKKEYPNIPFIISFTMNFGNYDKNSVTSRAIQDLLPYTDYIAMSTYPYLGALNPWRPNYIPDEMPKDWFSSFAALDLSKPFVVSETGWAAEPVYDTPANEAYQKRYVEILLSEAQKLNTKFVIWFTVRDYDATYFKLGDNPGNIGRLWRDTGLLGDEYGNIYDARNNRPALTVWDSYYNLAYIPK